ncbi:hypothetical protein D3C72_717250 [compost metagenome]
MERQNRLNLVNEGESHHMYMPEGKPSDTTQKVPNKGEIMFEEKHPADPLKDEATMHMSHRGGLASARTEHY